MKRKKDEFDLLDETTLKYMYWTESDRKWDRIRRLKAGGITEINQEDRLQQRAWAGGNRHEFSAMEKLRRERHDTSRPYIWTPKIADERVALEALRKTIVEAKVNGSPEDVVDYLEFRYDKLANKVQARVDRVGGIRHTGSGKRRQEGRRTVLWESGAATFMKSDKMRGPDSDED